VELALDVSNYSGPLRAEQASCWRALGYAHLVCGTQRPEITTQQLATAVEAGLTVAAYVYVYWDGDVRLQVEAALAAVAAFPVERLWIDCEDGAGGRGAAEILSLIEAALAACRDSPAGIYTGRWWWVPATGNSDRFRDLPLWHAEYTPPGTLPDPAGFRPYGGWERPAMWQFQGTTDVCGISVDRNLLLDSGRRDIELALFRAERRFLQALVRGDYVFRPAGEDASLVELQRVEGGRGVSFDPPYLLPLT
jgi:hypothetical protein